MGKRRGKISLRGRTSSALRAMHYPYPWAFMSIQVQTAYAPTEVALNKLLRDVPVCVIIPARCLLDIGGGATQVRFVRQLDDDEIRDLETMRRTVVGRVSQRAHMVLLSNRNYCIVEIARLFDASENTVRRWIERYERDGAGSFDDRSRRPSKPPPMRMSSNPLRAGLRIFYLDCGTRLRSRCGSVWDRGVRSEPLSSSSSWSTSSPNIQRARST